MLFSCYNYIIVLIVCGGWRLAKFVGEEKRMVKVSKNFIPEISVKCYDYFCTWQSQADYAKKKHGDVRDMRNSINSEFLFSEDGVLKKGTSKN